MVSEKSPAALPAQGMGKTMLRESESALTTSELMNVAILLPQI